MNGKSYLEATIDDQGVRIDKFISNVIGNFTLSQKLIRKKLIRVNGKKVAASYKLECDDQIEIFANLELKSKTNIIGKKSKEISKSNIKKVKSAIIFQDDNLIIINKPSGLAVQGGSNINFSINDSLPFLKFDRQETPKLVHRLDKDTSGILLIARHRKAADILTEAFRNKTINKEYIALVKGIPGKKSGIINMPIIKKYQGKTEKVYKDEIAGKEAITKYKVLHSDYLQDYSTLLLQPITGRTHQLRVHCKEIGHPIIGDGKYGDRNNKISAINNRLCLHALKIDIEDFFSKNINISTHQPLSSKNDYLQIFLGSA